LIGDTPIRSAVTGEFFSALPEGKQTIIVSTAGYETREIKAEITSAKVEELVVDLKKTGEE
jgi:hypothetical protein